MVNGFAKGMCLLIIAAHALSSSAQEIPSGPRFSYDATGKSWLVSDSTLFRLTATTGIVPRLSMVWLGIGRMELTLSLTNTSADTLIAEPVFPTLSGLVPAERVAGGMYYLFPSQGRFVSDEDVVLDEPYSGNFPLQFMSAYQPDHGGIYLLCKDTTNSPKRFRLRKKRNAITMEIEHRSRQLAPGESWLLPPMEVVVHDGDWRDAFLAYRDWVRTWYTPTTPRKDWFRNVYNFRQLFLHPIFGDVGAFDKKRKTIDLMEQVKQSQQAFGGVDYVHLFDWSQTPTQGRVGDYDPWTFLGGKRQLRRAVAQLRQQDIPTGLYHEGYLVSKISTIGRRAGLDWQLLSKDKEPYTRFGGNYFYPCPLVPAWRAYLAQAVRRSISDVGAAGAYIDQFGFGWQYACHNPAHHHDIRRTNVTNELQLAGELSLMKAIKRALPNEKVTYTEEMPTDVASQHQDGSFTYAIAAAKAPHRQNPARINLARFAIPDFKLFEILRVDEPMGMDTLGVKHVFFNGEGIWLAGPLNDPNWFPEPVRALIRKTNAILRKHRTAFASDTPIPLIGDAEDGIHINCFPADSETVWTLYNSSEVNQSAYALRVPYKPGARYYDCWNERWIEAQPTGNDVQLQIPLNAKGLGCVVALLAPTP